VRLLLSREAKLFDSELFIFKVFVSILTGYVLFHNHSIIGKDMISVLFGIMLSLEPVSVSGFKSGLGQIEASIIGGSVSAIIIYFGGINYITVPLAVALTIYITLTMDFRNLSIIAIFTSIYMTQFVQLNQMNEISVWLTFRLRMMAVISGVIVAVSYNYIFSKLFYKKLAKKRTIYLFEKLISNFSRFLDKNVEIDLLKTSITDTFIDADLIRNNIIDLQKENKNSNVLKKYNETILRLRNINHYLMDIILNDEIINGNDIENVINILKEQVKLLENSEKSFKYNENYESENKNVNKINIAIKSIAKNIKEATNG